MKWVALNGAKDIFLSKTVKYTKNGCLISSTEGKMKLKMSLTLCELRSLGLQCICILTIITTYTCAGVR